MDSGEQRTVQTPPPGLWRAHQIAEARARRLGKRCDQLADLTRELYRLCRAGGVRIPSGMMNRVKALTSTRACSEDLDG